MKHRILIIETEIRLYESGSLKEKRQLQQKILDRLKSTHNVSVTVTGQHELWNSMGMTIAYVALNQSAAEKMANTIENHISDILEQEGTGQISCLTSEII